MARPHRKLTEADRDEQLKPLRAYRAEEMARAYECFFGPDRSHHEARRRFTRKLGAAETTAAHPSPHLAGEWDETPGRPFRRATVREGGRGITPKARCPF